MNLSQYSVLVVTPVYDDIEASNQLFRELIAQFKRDVFVVAVDDGSVKLPLEITNLEDVGIDGVVLKLRRNVGHQKAIAIGLGFIADHIDPCQNVVVMDSDGEDLPTTIPNLLKKLNSTQVDVVVAQRKSRIETLRFKAFYWIYRHLFRLLTGYPINFGNFMVLRAHAVRRLVAMQELSLHLAATLLASKLRIGACPLDRGRRYAGQSKMNFVGLSLHGLKGLMVFAEDILVRIGIACSLTAMLSIVTIISTIMLEISGISTPVWIVVALGILILFFLQTGIFALMTLMLTSIVQVSTVATPTVFLDFIETIIQTKDHKTCND